MIESKQQLLDSFLKAAEAYLAEPTLVNGIDLDDATVTLKRYVLSELHDQATAIELAKISPLVKHLETTVVSQLISELRQRLQG